MRWRADCNVVRYEKTSSDTCHLGREPGWPPVTRTGGLLGLALALSATSACSKDVAALSPGQLERQYGITDAYAGEVSTPDGPLRGTLVPVTLPDGRRAQLLIPNRRSAQAHQAYISDDLGLHPIELQPEATRVQVVQAPVVRSRQVERAHPRQRSWEKELLIIGGSAGAGAGVGALAGGKKGAGIGAGAGGIGGLIYDLATRKNP